MRSSSRATQTRIVSLRDGCGGGQEGIGATSHDGPHRERSRPHGLATTVTLDSGRALATAGGHIHRNGHPCRLLPPAQTTGWHDGIRSRGPVEDLLVAESGGTQNSEASARCTATDLSCGRSRPRGPADEGDDLLVLVLRSTLWVMEPASRSPRGAAALQHRVRRRLLRERRIAVLSQDALHDHP
jgi:hypothetical protein